MGKPAEIVTVGIEEEIQKSYLDYAMSVIVGRALPDLRDGLKPVHRRILYAMHRAGNFWNRPYRKAARAVGDVIGQYHPHGDTAVYDSIVRMAQPFSLRYPFIDGQGNFGSVDGDAPAAMRYTEVRMAKISQAMLEDLDKDTVNFIPNYDNTQQEPVVSACPISRFAGKRLSRDRCRNGHEYSPSQLTGDYRRCYPFDSKSSGPY